MTPYHLLRDLNTEREDWLPQWADHRTVLLTPEGTVYQSEPYQLFPRAFRDFEQLEVHGWRVTVDSRATHNPGLTVRVRIVKVGGNQ